MGSVIDIWKEITSFYLVENNMKIDKVNISVMDISVTSVSVLFMACALTFK